MTTKKDDYYDDLLGRGKGDGDLHNYGKPDNVHYIGEDKPQVAHLQDPIADYTSLATENWYDTDNDARSPLEADLEDINEPMESDIG